MEKTNNKLRYIVYVGMMAAVCFVATYIRIGFVSAGASSPMIHLGTAACFIAAILLGGLGGGLAGGIGMSIFDLLNGYGSTAVFTLIIKFLSGFAAGKIAHARGSNGEKMPQNFIACIAGSIVSIFGYCLHDFIATVLTAGSGINGVQLGFKAAGFMAIASLLTSIIGIVLAPVIAAPLKQSLKKAHLL